MGRRKRKKEYVIIDKPVIFDTGETWEFGLSVEPASIFGGNIMCGICGERMDITNDGYIVCDHCEYGFKNKEAARRGIAQVYKSQ